MTMKRGELALFTLPADQGYGAEGCDNVHPNSVIQFEIEFFSWISVVDVRRDGGIIKKILEKGSKNGKPCDLDEVLVRYQVELLDGTVVAKSPDEGIVFCVNDDGFLCPALPLEVQRDLTKVPQCSTLIYEVEMLEFVKEKTPREMDNEEKIEAANGKKEEGNLLFKIKSTSEQQRNIIRLQNRLRMALLKVMKKSKSRL